MSSSTSPIRTEVHDITPEIARFLLEVNGNANRDVTQTRVQNFSSDMRAGRWPVTHQPIALTGPSLEEPGELLDGQHRLHAVIVAGVTVPMLIAFNTDPATFNVIDIGGTRTLPDLLTIRGYKNAKKLKTAWVYAWSWEHGNVAFVGPQRGRGISPDERLAETLERYPGLATMEYLSNPDLLSSGPLTFLAYITDSEEFIDDMLNCRPDTCGGQLGARYRNYRQNHRTMERRWQMAIAVKARNDHEAGNPPTTKLQAKGKDQFPVPQWRAPIPFAGISNGEEDDDA